MQGIGKKYPSSYLALLNIVWQLKYSSHPGCSKQGGEFWTFSYTRRVVYLSCSLHMSVLLLRLLGLVPTSPGKLGILHRFVHALESLALTLPFVAVWITKVICVNYLLFSRVWEQHWCSGVSPAKDTRIVRKFWNLHLLRHSNLKNSLSSMRWFDLLWAGCWTRDLQSSLPAQVPMRKAVYVSGWIFASPLSWTTYANTRKAATVLLVTCSR